MASPSRSDAARTLSELADGDPSAADRLLPLVYDELRSLARRYFRAQAPGHTLQPTALVHEAYIHLVGREAADSWWNRRHFLAVAAIAMRQVLVPHARRKGAQKRGGDWRQITLDEGVALTPSRTIDIIDLDDALRELARLHERQARVVELRLLGGLTIEETAEVVGVPRRTVEMDWRMARAWLRSALAEGEPR